MKRTLKFLARLYPSSWRKRYSAEFDALLEDAAPSARDAFDILLGALKMQITTWSFGRIMLASSAAGILVAAALSLVVPVHYLSESFVEVTPADGFAPESTRTWLDSLEQNVLSRDSLASIIQRHNLYPRERAYMHLDDVIDDMRRSISVHPITLASPKNQGGFNFAVQFDYSDPHVAQAVNAELTSRFIEGNLEMARQTSFRGTFEVLDPPSLPLKPTAPNRMRFLAVDLFAGLLSGLALAIALRSRRTTTAGNG